MLIGLVLTSQSILECNFHTHTDLLGHITVVHSQATYNVLIGRLTLTAALSGAKGENAAFPGLAPAGAEGRNAPSKI